MPVFHQVVKRKKGIQAVMVTQVRVTYRYSCEGNTWQPSPRPPFPLPFQIFPVIPLLRSASSFPLSAPHLFSAIASTPPSCTRLVADGCLSTRASRLPFPHKHLPIRERIHTCPGRLLCQHQFVSGMCEVSPHLHLPL